MDLDKFYTPLDTAKYCIDTLNKALCDKLIITEYLEPSAGSGAFSTQINGCVAYDIEPEHETIIKQDFLELDLPYKKGRVIIGNPPFGYRNNLSLKFYKKSVSISDAIGFILPISQLNNSDSLYEFDLIESVDLGVLVYSGLKVHCCFNVYTRPEKGLNKKPKIEQDLIIIYREDYKYYDKVDYHFAIYRRGSQVGLIRSENLHTQTYKIFVKDESKIDFVKKTILEFDWLGYKNHQSAPSLSKNDILRLFSC